MKQQCNGFRESDHSAICFAGDHDFSKSLYITALANLLYLLKMLRIVNRYIVTKYEL